jgi:hypothetical protein
MAEQYKARQFTPTAPPAVVQRELPAAPAGRGDSFEIPADRRESNTSIWKATPCSPRRRQLHAPMAGDGTDKLSEALAALRDEENW